MKRTLNAKNWWINLLGKYYVFHSITHFMVLCRKNMVSKKSKIVCSVKVSRPEFVSLPIVDQLQPNLYKLPCVEQRITNLDWKSTMCSVVKCPWIFMFILLCLIFFGILILFIYIINIGYWQVLFIT